MLLLYFFRHVFKATRMNLVRYSLINLCKLSRVRNLPKLLAASVGVANVMKITEDIKKKDNIISGDESTTTNFHAAITKNLSDLELKTTCLINILYDAILETGEKYRQCLQMQISIYELGDMIDENHTKWDLLIENRNEAANLKTKLLNYIDMVQFVGKTVENVILLSTVMKMETADVIRYFELKNLAEVENIEYRALEKKLLKSTMQNVIQSNI